MSVGNGATLDLQGRRDVADVGVLTKCIEIGEGHRGDGKIHAEPDAIAIKEAAADHRRAAVDVHAMVCG